MQIDIKYYDKEHYLYLKLTGELIFDRKILEDPTLIQAVQNYNCNKVLIDVKDLDVTISTMNSYAVGIFFANLRHTNVKIKTAILAQPFLIDGFIEVVAKNRGALFEVFSDEQKAVEWLL